MLDKIIGGVWSYVAIVALVALLAGLVYSGYSHGIAIGDAKVANLQASISAAALVEDQRQSKANADAKTREAIRIAVVDAQSKSLQVLRKQLDDAQDNDPTSSDDCINDAGRVRLNQIDGSSGTKATTRAGG